MRRKYYFCYECDVQHLKECSPAKCWGEIKRLSGMVGSFESPVIVLQSVHRLKGARDLSADDLANNTPT